jgi:hypothetical protein
MITAMNYDDELYDAVNGLVENGFSDAAIRAELSEADPEILDDLIDEIREAQ